MVGLNGRTVIAIALAGALASTGAGEVTTSMPAYDVLIRGGTIYDGSGGVPFVGDVATKSDHIVYVGRHAPGVARMVVQARGRAVAPGFINMLSQATDSLLVDGRGESDLRQGVTLEVMGEGLSMGPYTEEMKRVAQARQGDIRYRIDWTTLDQYLTRLERRGVSMNVASFVGAATVRVHELGEGNIQPTPENLEHMRALVRQAMEDGALGLGAAIIYAPSSYSTTAEFSALAREAGDCGGVYAAHMRSEGDALLEAIDETIAIAKSSGAPAEIWHLKAAGKSNWQKLGPAIAKIAAARASGIRVSADMYTYTAGATGLDAAMPPWVQEGGLEKWIARLKEPRVRAKVVEDMRDPKPGWENLYRHAGAPGTLLLGFRNEKLKPLTGKTLADVARLRGESPEEAAIDLVIEDGSRVGVAFFLMSEDNVKREVALPWISFGSDEAAEAPRGVFLKSKPHPRAYGNFARLLGRYVRDEKMLTLPDAIRRLSALPASNLGLRDRGRLKAGYYADLVVFDPKTIADHATFAAPQQFATGISDVLVNGGFALKEGIPTGAPTGRVVRGRGWRGWPGGGCRASARNWSWSK